MEDTADNLPLAREDLQYWYDCIELCDGKSWLKRDACIHLCGDASKVGYGAYTPDCELQHPMVMSFDAKEIDHACKQTVICFS